MRILLHCKGRAGCNEYARTGRVPGKFQIADPRWQYDIGIVAVGVTGEEFQPQLVDPAHVGYLCFAQASVEFLQVFVVAPVQ